MTQDSAENSVKKERRFKSSFGPFLRTLSAVLVATFLVQDLASAQGGAPTWSAVDRAAREAKPAARIDIAAEDATARKHVVHDADPRFVVNIQDAHSKIGAQKSISHILESLVRNYDLRLVALEGGTGTIDTSVVSSFPVETVREKTASYLLKEGKISAGEFYSMVSGSPVKLYGVDDPALYRENLEAFRSLVDRKAAVRAQLKTWKDEIRALEEKIYSPELLDLSRRRLLRAGATAKFTEYWEYFESLARQKGLTPDRYPNLKRLSETVAMEKAIDFKKASEQRDALLALLNRALPKPDLEALAIAAVRYRQNKISAGKFHLALAALSRKAGADPSQYGDLILYSQYAVLYESIDLVDVFDEASAFENDVREKFFRNEDERRLAALTHRVTVLSQLLDTALTARDYAEFSKDRAAYAVPVLKEEFSALSGRYGASSSVDFAALEAAMPDASKFYELADLRNRALFQNTLSRMKKDGVELAALVTGGFHSEGIASLVDEARVSCLVVMPRFDVQEGDRPYVAILTRRPREFEEQFKDSDFYLAYEIAGMTKGSRPDAELRALVEERIRRLVIDAKPYLKEGRLPADLVAQAVENYKLAAARLAQ